MIYMIVIYINHIQNLKGKHLTFIYLTIKTMNPLYVNIKN